MGIAQSSSGTAASPQNVNGWKKKPTNNGSGSPPSREWPHGLRRPLLIHDQHPPFHPSAPDELLSFTVYLATQTQTLDRRSSANDGLDEPPEDSQIDSLSTLSTLDSPSTAAVEQGLHPEKAQCKNAPILQSGFSGEGIPVALVLMTSQSVSPHLASWAGSLVFCLAGETSFFPLFPQPFRRGSDLNSPFLWCARVGPHISGYVHTSISFPIAS